MARKQHKKRRGPYLAAAFFCDQVVRGHDQALTAVRITDNTKFLIPANAPADFPSKNNRASVEITSLLSFKTGYAPAGEHTVRVVMESPSGKLNPVYEQKVPFSAPPYGGANLILLNNIQMYKGGVFWFKVYLDGKLMTEMPFQLTYERQQPAPSTPSPAGNDSTPAPVPDSSQARKNGKEHKPKR
jgi:hypothetical protein